MFRDGVGAVELQHQVVGEDVLHHGDTVLRLRLRQLYREGALDQVEEKQVEEKQAKEGVKGEKREGGENDVR